MPFLRVKVGYLEVWVKSDRQALPLEPDGGRNKPAGTRLNSNRAYRILYARRQQELVADRGGIAVNAALRCLLFLNQAQC